MCPENLYVSDPSNYPQNLQPITNIYSNLASCPQNLYAIYKSICPENLQPYKFSYSER